MVEGINAEIKRRTNIFGAFPSRDSLLRHIISILSEMDEEWVTGIRYLNMADVRDTELPNAECRSCIPVSEERLSLVDL